MSDQERLEELRERLTTATIELGFAQDARAEAEQECQKQLKRFIQALKEYSELSKAIEGITA